MAEEIRNEIARRIVELIPKTIFLKTFMRNYRKIIVGNLRRRLKRFRSQNRQKFVKTFRESLHFLQEEILFDLAAGTSEL